MITPRNDRPLGLLTSGGLDSCILLHRLLSDGHAVQPFYIESGLYWQRAELAALRAFLRAVRQPGLAELVVLELPLADLYADHWSVTGRNVPGADSPDEAVYLPGRNALLIVKAAVWCRLHGIAQLALAPLGTSPFDDATAQYFAQLESALNLETELEVQLMRPFADYDKPRVMQLGRTLPLELTFSCLAPVDGLHCGACNKCAERQAAFRELALTDPTVYSSSPAPCGNGHKTTTAGVC